MRLLTTVTLLVAASLPIVCGCGDKSQSVESASAGGENSPLMLELVPDARPPIPDLPVPIGFKMDEGESLDYALHGARFVNHKYKGGSEKLAVKRFYERYMPVNRWTLTTAMFVSGDIMMDFEKETERCRVTITGGTLFSKSYIYVRLWTSGPIQSATEQAQPVE